LILLSSVAAHACGIVYEQTPGQPPHGCSNTAAIAGATIVGGTAIAVTIAWAVFTFLRGGPDPQLRAHPQEPGSSSWNTTDAVR